MNAVDEQMAKLRNDALGMDEGGGFSDIVYGENNLARNKPPLDPDSPAGQAYSKQMNDLATKATVLEKELELARKAEKKAAKKASKEPTTIEEKIDVVKTQGEARRNQARGKPDVLEMKIDEAPAGGSALDQSIVAKRSFNEDLEKYRYGSPKDPLTLEEYKHLQNSDFIEKQNMFDILKERNPDYIEHSFWYKDKDGVVTNMEHHNGELGMTKIDKNNPNKETVYSKSNPDREDEWVFVKSQNENGVGKVLERFEVKDTFSPRHPKLKDWPAEFTNSKYDME